MTTQTTTARESGSINCSGFLQQQIEKRLQELRDDVALQLQIRRSAFGRRWARSARSDEGNRLNHGSSDPYWDGRQREAMDSTREAVNDAEDALRDFISEHRSMMGNDWIGNDHGRLCFMSFLGGRPIDRHYCQREEGHEGFCQGPKGAWPCGVSCDREWRELQQVCGHGLIVDWCEQQVCENCGKVQS